MGRYRLEVGAATETGRQRDRNEDRFAAQAVPPAEGGRIHAFLLVADGLGGERGGERASQLVADRLIDRLIADDRGPASDAEGGGEAPDDSDGELETGLHRTIREVSDELFALGETDPDLRGLGSTLVLALAHGERLTIAHVGDSRCYRLRGRRIERLTTDHTWVENQVGVGALTPEEARSHPRRGILTRSLGDAVRPAVDVRTEELREDDLFLLCSDGLTVALTDGEIEQIASRYLRAQDVAEALVAVANTKDGSDNITVVVARSRLVDAGHGDGETDDTEPIVRPEDLVATPVAARGGWWALAGFVLGLLMAYLGLSLYAARLYDRAVAYSEDRQYLFANRELLELLDILLDEEQSRRVLAIYEEYVETRHRPADAEPAPPPPEPAPPPPEPPP